MMSAYACLVKYLSPSYGSVSAIFPFGGCDISPCGKIELTLPYDGERYFTRQAYADIIRLYNPTDGDARALVGHLALTGYGQTNLGGLLDLGETYGSIPITVPVPATSGQPDYLIADR